MRMSWSRVIRGSTARGIIVPDETRFVVLVRHSHAPAQLPQAARSPTGIIRRFGHRLTATGQRESRWLAALGAEAVGGVGHGAG
jgi:hypothetical protein